MELWQLRTFSVVAKNLHFTRAAEELNLSQPAVSHQIKALEAEIGEPLFLRDKNGILLTKTGQMMFQHATKILDIADEMRLEIRENEDILSGKIILGAATRGLGHSFPLIYKKFKEIYPDIDVIFQLEYKFDDIIEKVRNGTIDIGMISHDLDYSGLVVMPYGEYDLLLIVGSDHRFAKLKEITIDELQNEDWVMFEPGNRLRTTIENNLNQAGIKPKIAYETNDGSILLTMLEDNTKVSFLPEWGILEKLRDGKLISIKIKDLKFKVQVFLIWKVSRRTKVMSAVLSYLLEEKLQGIKPLESE